MNKANVISPSMLLIQPDYSTPVWTREQNESWYYEFMREIGVKDNGADNRKNQSAVRR